MFVDPRSIHCETSPRLSRPTVYLHFFTTTSHLASIEWENVVEVDFLSITSKVKENQTCLV